MELYAHGPRTKDVTFISRNRIRSENQKSMNFWSPSTDKRHSEVNGPLMQRTDPFQTLDTDERMVLDGELKIISSRMIRIDCGCVQSPG